MRFRLYDSRLSLIRWYEIEICGCDVECGKQNEYHDTYFTPSFCGKLRKIITVNDIYFSSIWLGRAGECHSDALCVELIGMEGRGFSASLVVIWRSVVG